jgi:pyridoxamine 5'-phosphate oxidase
VSTDGAPPPAAHSEPLSEGDVASDPLVQFERWFDRAAGLVRMPEAAAIATATSEGRPSVRMVLVKAWSDDGFLFHTNYGSRKGRELEANPFGALLFHWDPLGRQVRIEGPVERATSRESDDYFATRPLGAQIGAHASRQSRPVDSRATLDRRVEELTGRFAAEAVPRPDWWGGFRLRPRLYEFWQNRDDRLHDRLVYVPDGHAWRISRLQP